ncbi:unnamed protein product [Lota lota]
MSTSLLGIATHRATRLSGAEEATYHGGHGGTLPDDQMSSGRATSSPAGSPGPESTPGPPPSIPGPSTLFSGSQTLDREAPSAYEEQCTGRIIITIQKCVAQQKWALDEGPWGAVCVSHGVWQHAVAAPFNISVISSLTLQQEARDTGTLESWEGRSVYDLTTMIVSPGRASLAAIYTLCMDRSGPPACLFAVLFGTDRDSANGAQNMEVGRQPKARERSVAGQVPVVV